jgi:hypothetical protein
MKERYKSPMDGLPDEHMRMVGVISAHWEYLEILLERAIADIMGRNFYEVQLLTENISFTNKCDLVLIYARPFEKAEPDEWKKFTSAIADLKAAHGARNEYVHAHWKQDQKTNVWGKAGVRTKGGKLVVSDSAVDIEDMSKAAQQIWDAAVSFLALCQRHNVLTTLS